MTVSVIRSARGARQSRHLDPDRRAEQARPAQHDPVRCVADPARAAAHGGPRLHDALHPLARGQGRADLDQPLDGPAAGDGGMPAGPCADDRLARRFAGGIGRRPLCRPAEGARRGRHRHRRRLPRHRRRAQDGPAGLSPPPVLAAEPDRAPPGRPQPADRLRRRRHLSRRRNRGRPRCGPRHPARHRRGRRPGSTRRLSL